MRPYNSEIDKEQDKITENIMPLREEREKTLHPFVQQAVNEDSSGAKVDNTREPFSRHLAKEYTAIQPKDNIQNTGPDKQGINLAFLSIILISFLLTYFFIRPKSR